MRTTISIPDHIIDRVERLARRSGRSRSELFSAALKEYLARHSPSSVTRAMNRFCDEIESEPSGFRAAAAYRVLRQSEW